MFGRNELTLGYSPCPNDTFIFHPLISGLVPSPLPLREQLEDVETLNLLVRSEKLDISKVSYQMFGHMRDRYCLLRAGSALGRGCGPLLVSKRRLSPIDLIDSPIAVPGEFTTACLLLKLFDPRFSRLVFMPFHEIMDKVVKEEVAAGVIIHESRFTYESMGLVSLLDLGAWWEESSSSPIPLGGIVAKRSLGKELINAFDKALAVSVAYSTANPEMAKDYIRAHAQEMSAEVCAAHINLYVNEFTRDLGDEGIAAVQKLMTRAEDAGVIPKSNYGLFAE